jgi:hypothetical protein
MKDQDRIEERLWQRARERARSAEGLVIDGLGVIRGGAIEAGARRPHLGYDAPALIVEVADALGVPTETVRGIFSADVAQAVASAVERPAPLGRLGLIEAHDGQLAFTPSRRDTPAPAGAVDRALAAWREPAETTAARVDKLVDALRAIPGALPVADQRRLLDELDYDLDPPDWQRFGPAIVGAFPF